MPPVTWILLSCAFQAAVALFWMVAKFQAGFSLVRFCRASADETYETPTLASSGLPRLVVKVT